jgi:hypothetical protein
MSFPNAKPYQAFILAFMGFIIIPIIFKPNYEQFKIAKEVNQLQLNKKLIIVFIIFVLIFRFGLGFGLKI